MKTLYHIEYEDFYAPGEFEPTSAHEMSEEEYIHYRQNGGMWDYYQWSQLTRKEQQFVYEYFKGASNAENT